MVITNPKTLLRYPGGKRKLAPFIAELLDVNGLKGGVYIEPYAGGGGVAMELLFNGLVDKVVLNDKCNSLCAFWRALLSDPVRFAELVMTVPLNMEEWKRRREIIRTPHVYDQFEVGFSLFYLNRTNFSGVIAGGVIGGYEQQGNYKMDARFPRKRLARLAQEFTWYRDRITVCCKDAVSLLREDVPHVGKKVFLYCDPPYYHKGQQLYMNAYGHGDHAEVAHVLQREVSIPWVVSYDAEPEIMKLYSACRQFTFDLQYSARKKMMGKELFILGPGVKMPQIPSLECIRAVVAAQDVQA